MFYRKKKVIMEFRIAELTPSYIKQEAPACCCCGYDATYLLKVGSLQRFFCERDLRDALLDAINFAAIKVPEYADLADGFQ